MIEAYKEWLIEQDSADETVKSYVSNVGLYMRWYRETFGEDMTELLHSNVLDYRSYLQNTKRRKATTINTKLSALISLDMFLTEIGRQKMSVVSKKIYSMCKPPMPVWGI